MHKAFFFQMAVKAINQEQGDVIIEGFASTPDIDRYRDIVEPSAFADALNLYMKNPVLLRSHDANMPAGRVLSTLLTDQGLKITASVTEEKTREDVLAGRMSALSIGYIPQESTLQHEDGSAFNAEKDSPWDADLVRVIKKLDLVEISIVSTPANGNALFSIAKSVKSYFNEVVTKNFMLKKDAPSNKTVPAEVPPVEPPKEETKDDETKSEEVKEETQKQTAEQPQADKPEEKSSEEAEKGGEIPPTDSGEAPKSEEPKAEAEPKNEPEEKSAGLILSKKTAQALSELVDSGVASVDEEGKTADLPDEVSGFIRKLIDLSLAQEKEISTLTEKLNNTPAKQALVPMGQFSEPSEKNEEQKGPTPFIKQLFNLN